MKYKNVDNLVLTIIHITGTFRYGIDNSVTSWFCILGYG